MKTLKSTFLILILNTLKISWGKSILQPTIGVLHATLNPISTPVANNGIRFFNQGFPQYQTLTQTKSHQLPVWISPQGIISYSQGQNNQLFQVPFNAITTASGNVHSGSGLITLGSSQGDVSSHPLSQSHSLNRVILGDAISLPGINQLLESIKFGNGNIVPVSIANGVTGYIQSGGTIGPQSILSTGGTLIQSPTRPNVSIQNTLSGGGGLQGQGVTTSFPNQVQYPTIGYSSLQGQGVITSLPDHVQYPSFGYGNINVPKPNIVPTASGVTGYIQSGGTTGPLSILSTGGTLIQSPTRPNVPIQNTLSGDGGQAVIASYPNHLQYPTIGYSNMNVPNVRPLDAGIIYTSGSTSQGTDTSANNVASVLQNPGVQTQMIQVPCTLHIPSPVPISVKPGISQISTNIPMNQLSSIPSSFIDNSPPTIAILRPPSSLDTLQNSNYASLPVAVSTTHLRKSTNGPYAIDAKPPSFVTTTIREETKENSRSQDSAGVLVQNDDPSESELKFTSGLARNNLPIQYSTRPLYTTGVSPTAMAADRTSTRKQVKSPTSRPTRGKNPFFSVNKRKHFEFYSYF